MIKNVIFDIGNVLIPWDARKYFCRHFSSPEEIEEFLKNSNFSAWNLKRDAGWDIDSALAEIKEKSPQYLNYFQQYYDNFEVALGEPISENVQLITKLKSQGINVFALTNYSSDLFVKTLAIKKYSFLQEFAGIVVSGDEGVVKPDKKIFQILCQRYQLIPEESIFIDDMKANVESAAALGFKAIQFIEGRILSCEL